MSEKWSLRAELARKIRLMASSDAALWVLMFFLLVVMPTLAGAGYLLAYLADLLLGCGA